MKRNFTQYIFSSLLPYHADQANSDLHMLGVDNKDNNYMEKCYKSTGTETPNRTNLLSSSYTFFKSFVLALSMLVMGIGSLWGQAPGNNCASAVALTSPAIGATITTGAQTTCGRVGDFAAGFSSVNTLYGGGEDGVYSMVVPAGGGNYTFTFAASGATYKILSIHSACAPTTANTLGGFVTGTATGGSVTLNLTAGTRFIIIDTWPTPNCGAFTLSITRNNPPNPCATAINIPSAPVTNQALSCNATAVPGALNATNVPTACGGASNNYKGGQDAIYTFTPTTTGSYTISYTGVTYSAIFVYSGACPASGGTCVGSVGSAGSAQSLALTLTAGVQYFIWFDTWPTPNSPCPGTFSISAPPVPPTISSITPTSGCPGTTITINGTNLTGATAANVRIGGTPVTAILTNTATQITATVGAGTTGVATVITTNGTANGTQTYTVLTAPAAPTANAAASVTSTSAIASWSASAGATLYFLDVATDAAFTAFVAGYNNLNVGNVTSFSITGLTANTTYFYRVRGSNGSCSGLSSGTITFSTGYCASTSTTATYFITNFTTAAGQTNIANASNAYSASGYGNFTAQSASNFIGSSTSYTATWNTTGGVGFGVWIDWNNDFDFLDANEAVYVSTAYNFTTSYTGAITVPAGTANGNYRMRIRIDYNLGAPTSCGSITAGETEDYTFTVVTAPACATLPSALVSSNVAGTTATISWTAASPAPANGYQYFVSTSPTAPTAGTTPTGSTAAGVVTANLTGLTPSATHYFWVRSRCNATDFSTWVGSASFLTPCASSIVTTTISVNETFNTTSTTLNCWRVQGSGLSVVTAGTNPTSSPQEGNQMIQFNSYSLTSGTQGRLFSMPLNTTGTTSLTVDFYWLNENNTAYATYTTEGVQVQYSTDGGATWTNTGSFFTRHDGNLAAGTSQWNLKSVDVGAVGVGSNILIGFLFTSQYGDNCYLDNVTFKQSCIAPGNPATYGSGSWIGYVYNSITVGGFDIYRGFVTESEIFNRTHTTPSGATINHCSSNQDMFTIRYRMTKNFPAGDYIFTVGGDDGVRLSIDGGATWLINQWANQAYATYSNTTPVSLNGNVDLVFEYYENTGGAQSSFSYALAPVPGCATYTSPANGATGTVVNPTLTWGAVANATSYDVYLGIGSLPATPTATVTGTSYSAICNGLSNYVWMVVPKNAQGAATGCATWSFTTMSVAYATAWISANTGNTWWCQGETRNVTVTIKNNGTVDWIDGGGDDYNVGIKWNGDPDYLVRVDAQNLAAGATATYSFTVTAPSAGNNNLTFDVVKEASFWFGNNNNGAGPGNTTYASTANVNDVVPVINAGADTTICLGQSVTLNGSSVIRPSLNQVLAAINANQSTLLASIPTPYGFTMDMGVNSNYISDGGGDMYDGGNYINSNIATNINYSDNSVISSASFGTGGRYFTRAIGNMANSTTVPTIFYWAADLNGVTTVSISGNNGADGSGTQNINTFTVSANNVTYNCFLKRVYGATDPSINQLFIVPQPSTITTAMGATTDDNLFSISGLTGVDRMYYMLYAGNGGAQISVAQATTIAQTFVNALSVSGTVSWTSNPTGFTSSLSTPSVTPTTTTTYTLSGSYNGCTATSDDVVVTVSPTSVAGTAAAVQSAICSGANTTINLTGSTGTIQWQQSADGSTGWTNVSAGSGATTGAYTTANLTTTTYYRAVVTSGACSATNSNVITVTVYSALVAGAHNTTTLNVCDGVNPAALTFTTAVSGGSGSYNYQWQNNGVDIGGAITNSYDPPVLTPGNYSYRCMISDGCNIVYTTPKVINVAADPDAPTATKSPALTSVCVGTTLTVASPVYGANAGQSCGFEYGFSTDNGVTWSAVSTTVPSFTSTGTNNRIRVRVAGGCATGCNASNWTEYSWTVNATPTASVTGTNTICSGASTTFTASGGTSYLWSTGAATAAITASTAQTYTVTVTDANGCTATNNRTLTVNANPTASITGTNAVCTGGSTTFTASGGTSYLWSTGAATAAISPSTAQTYTVTVTDANGCTASSNRTLTVNANPTASITGTNAICTGGSTTFTASGGTSYLWNTGAATAAISPSTAQTYTVTVTDVNGCTASSNRTLTVNAIPSAPTANTTQNFCLGNSATVVDLTTTSGTGIQWYNVSTGGSALASGTALSNGTYYVSQTSSGCESSRLAVTVSTNAQPTDPAGIATNDVLWKGGAANPNDWSTASNWYVKTAGGYTVASATPGSTTNVFVGSSGSCINTSVLNLSGLTRCKNLYIESGATLNLGGNSDVLEVYGNWDNNGTLNANTSTVKFISANNQSMNSAASKETFYNLYIDNNNSSNQNYMLMNKSVNVLNTFHMEGNVRMNTSTVLEIGSATNPGEVLWHDGVVIGPMKRWFLGNSSINVQSPSFHNVTTGSPHLNPAGIFPVGTLRTLVGGAVEHEHKNASVNFKTPVTTAGHLTVEFITSNAGVLNANNNITTSAQTIGGTQVNSVASTSGLNAIDFYGYWRIDASAALMTVNYDASFRALNIDLGSNPADVRILKTAGYSTWNDGVAANNGSNTTMHTLNGANVHNDRVYSIENLLGFSGFTFGYNGSTLPIQLSSFTGETDNAVNYLKWTTQSEQNSSHFEMERSVDAINFEMIGRVNAMGVSNQVKQYSFNDVNPIRGMNYYRLKMVDIDGTNANSNTIALEIKGKETTFVLFPNPTSDVVSYQYEAETNESLYMEVVNALGQVVISQTRAARVGTNSVPMNLSELAPGAYTVRVKHVGSGITHSEKIIKK